jgi:hypothetical protein
MIAQKHAANSLLIHNSEIYLYKVYYNKKSSITLQNQKKASKSIPLSCAYTF